MNDIKHNLEELSNKLFKNSLDTLDDNQLFELLMIFTKEKIYKKNKIHSDRKLYYVSAEFLIGKLLTNNLINLGLYDEVNSILKEMGTNITNIETYENEPSLGNGGLGRLAACFVDSISTLGLNGSGVGINYHFGLFEQTFTENKQTEIKNKWMDKTTYLNKTDIVFPVHFSDVQVDARLYQIPIVGYEDSTKSGYNNLNLFDIDSVDESLVSDGIDFDKNDIKKNLTLFLYPDDSDDNGKKLRIYQEYFLVSCAAQLILQELKEAGHDIIDLPKYAVIQINDTHPAMIIPELIRLLMMEGVAFNTAVDLVTKTVAYTNHTILSEALEKWSYDFLAQVVPQLMPIIDQLDSLIKDKYDDEGIYIVSDNSLNPKDKIVHMAHMAIHYSFSVNGVAQLHTDILQKQELNAFYKIYPTKFNNKTNGITFRRWLMASNPQLCELVESLIGDGFKKDASELTKLMAYVDDEDVINKLLNIKLQHKKILADFIHRNEGISINPNSIYDIQIKRFHEYKRQQLNALYVITKYLEIKSGIIPPHPITVIFGGKAAPAYTIAKDIIHLILVLQKLINQQPDVKKHLSVVMVQNYNVSYAQRLIPACDISEQISLASKEASGTGNMKLMLNGALTLCTMDGANVKIAELVSKNPEAIYVFGDSSDTVIQRYADASYQSKDYYHSNERLHQAVDFIISEQLLKIGDSTMLNRLYNELLTKDWFMTFPDFDDYVKAKDLMITDYMDRMKWGSKMIVNIANAGYFSSDRTIKEYNEDIWKI